MEWEKYKTRLRQYFLYPSLNILIQLICDLTHQYIIVNKVLARGSHCEEIKKLYNY